MVLDGNLVGLILGLIAHIKDVPRVVRVNVEGVAFPLDQRHLGRRQGVDLLLLRGASGRDGLNPFWVSSFSARLAGVVAQPVITASKAAAVLRISSCFIAFLISSISE